VIAINAENGEIQWYHNLDKFYSGSQGNGAQANPALFYNNELFITSGYDHPGILFSVDGDNSSVKVKWINKTLNTHHGGVVLVDGNLYGSNWQNNARGNGLL
jgi:outer membrane protein assembly factor BamB